MATTYNAGNQTKEKIIKEARKLFYKQGFSATTYDDISKAAKINRALIPYHFNSKQILGQNIYSQIINDFLNNIDSIFDVNEFSADFVSILHIVAYYQLLKNKQFTSFLYELQADLSFSTFMEESEKAILSGLLSKSTKLSPSEIQILISSEIGMKKELVHLMHTTTIDVNEAAKLQLFMLLSYAGYSKKKIEELYDSAMQVIELLDFKINNNFSVIISFV